MKVKFAGWIIRAVHGWTPDQSYRVFFYNLQMECAPLITRDSELDVAKTKKNVARKSGICDADDLVLKPVIVLK